MSVSATNVKELREKTGAGMLDCKKALEEAFGDMTHAVEILRKRGVALAAKKASRTAADGTLGYYYNDGGKLAALLEVNCETDFVVKTDDFQDFVEKATRHLVQSKPGNLETFLNSKLGGGTVKDHLSNLVGKIGENIQVRRFELWGANPPKEKIGFYLHAGNKIGVLVRFSDPDGKLSDAFAKEVAMHVAAMNPQYVRKGEIPKDVLEKEKEICRAQMDDKKPADIREKILEGKLNKYLSDICLEDQIFVKDPQGKKSVVKCLQEVAPKVRIEKFVRLQVGEGIK